MSASEAGTRTTSMALGDPDLGRSAQIASETKTVGAPLLSITEVAARLGVQVRHVRRLVYERRIPYIKWGRLLRFDPAEVEAWVDECRRP